MSTATTNCIDTSTWEVPAHTVTSFQPKANSVAVVIPVINEGERIKRQLSKMSKLNVHETADIVIVDGGSTDGSLQHAFLEEMHVRSLLVKTGPGKLSAQLRCAYAFCLQEDYQGIITIDGNDKDNPEAIAEFVRELENGVDFVQGSRFISGGRAINTPWTRWLAIRLIHAPLLSRAAGFHWTDTTNGFRAYSRGMLLDPRVRPFRSVFESYELLAYLSVRGPRLGFACKEVPVERRYPGRGKTPTKIKGWKGNAGLIQVLISALMGKYDPQSTLK